jgi:tetratricopeptide (TPR) repeat protein
MIGDKVMEGHALRGLGQLALQKDNLEEAEEIYLEALEALQKIGDDNCVASVSRGLGEVAQRKGEFDKAAQFLRQSLRLYKMLGIDDYVALLIDRFASLSVALEKRERAARLLGASKDLEGTPKQISPPQYRKERVNLTNSIRKLLGEKEFKKLFEEGAAMSLEDAAAYALEESGEIE